jgi:hypothetical protein
VTVAIFNGGLHFELGKFTVSATRASISLTICGSICDTATQLR